MAAPGDPFDGVVDHFDRWLRMMMTGCKFAARLASQRMVIQAFAALPSSAELDALLDLYAEQDRPATFIFHRVADERRLLRYLQSLELGSTRWRTSITRQAENVLVGVEWRTRESLVCDMMGFAPFPMMPVARRAPYVALAGWPGGRRNPMARQRVPARDNRVSFLDAYLPQEQSVFDDDWDATTTAVASIFLDPPDKPGRYRRVAYTLSSAACSRWWRFWQ